MANLASITDESFEQQVLKASHPVLVDFSATWCGPCKALTPVLEELAGEYDGRVHFFNADVDEARATAMRFGIASVPTVLIFNNGEVVSQAIGLRPKEDLAGMLDSALAG
ncbi:MAG: thioredoxin [Acidobacteriota bacterium]|nr:MAG: thioredoxin [Acidobacteriota bacterium]